MYVCMCVCPSTFVNSARTAGLIGTWLVPIDAPKRRNDDGTGRGSIDGVHSARVQHVQYAYAQALSLSGHFELATRNLVH